MDTISYLYFPHWLRFSGLHGVAGNVAALADGHALCRGTVRLLYADDREKARESLIMEDGSFSFAYLPEGKYILQISGAQDTEQPSNAFTATAAKPVMAVHYADKEIPLHVLSDEDEIQIQLAVTPPDKLPAKE